MARRLNRKEFTLAVMGAEPGAIQFSETHRTKIHSNLAGSGDTRINGAMALNRMVDGRPGLLISPKCKVTRKGMAGGYHYKRGEQALARS